MRLPGRASERRVVDAKRYSFPGARLFSPGSQGAEAALTEEARGKTQSAACMALLYERALTAPACQRLVVPHSSIWRWAANAFSVLYSSAAASVTEACAR